MTYLGRVLHDDAQLRPFRDEALEVLHHVLAVHLGQNAALVDGRLLLGPPRPELDLLDHERASLRQVALSRDGVHHPERALTELALHLEVLHARRIRARGHHLAHAHARGGLGLQRGVRQHRDHDVRCRSTVAGNASAPTDTPLQTRLRRRTPGRSANGRNARRRTRTRVGTRDRKPPRFESLVERCASRCAQGTDAINVDQSKRDEKKATFWRFFFTAVDRLTDERSRFVSSGERRNAKPI